MKVRLINKDGKEWTFKSVKDARPHIKKERLNDYEIKERNGEKVRVYDDREWSIMEYENFGSSHCVYNAKNEMEAWNFLESNGVDLSKVKFIEYEKDLKRHIFHDSLTDES